jgi:hypothetical protein
VTDFFSRLRVRTREEGVKCPQPNFCDPHVCGHVGGVANSR